MQRNDPGAALELWQRALAIEPGHPSLRNNLALVHKRLERFADSEALLRGLVADHPDDADAWSNLGEVCKAQAKLPEAVEALRRAMACTGSQRAVHDNLLLLLHYLPEAGRAELAAAHRRYGERFPMRATAPHGNPADPERPLRIGYLSPDIRRHASMTDLARSPWVVLVSSNSQVKS